MRVDLYGLVHTAQRYHLFGFAPRVRCSERPADGRQRLRAIRPMLLILVVACGAHDEPVLAPVAPPSDTSSTVAAVNASATTASSARPGELKDGGGGGPAQEGAGSSASVLHIAVDRVGALSVDGRPLANDQELVVLARGVAAKNPNAKAVIAGGRDVRYGRIVQVTDRLREGKISEISFTPVPPGGRSFGLHRFASEMTARATGSPL